MGGQGRGVIRLLLGAAAVAVSWGVQGMLLLLLRVQMYRWGVSAADLMRLGLVCKAGVQLYPGVLESQLGLSCQRVCGNAYGPRL